MRLERDSNPWPPRYQCDALQLSYEVSLKAGQVRVQFIRVIWREWHDVYLTSINWPRRPKVWELLFAVKSPRVLDQILPWESRWVLQIPHGGIQLHSTLKSRKYANQNETKFTLLAASFILVVVVRFCGRTYISTDNFLSCTSRFFWTNKIVYDYSFFAEMP